MGGRGIIGGIGDGGRRPSVWTGMAVAGVDRVLLIGDVGPAPSRLRDVGRPAGLKEEYLRGEEVPESFALRLVGGVDRVRAPGDGRFGS